MKTRAADEAEFDTNREPPVRSLKSVLPVALLLLAALVAAVLLSGLLPSGVDDVTFEYEAVLKEAVYDEEGHPSYLLATLIPDGGELVVRVQRGQKAVTPTGKTAFKNLAAGTLLFISVDEDYGDMNTDPPQIMADVVMTKNVG